MPTASARPTEEVDRLAHDLRTAIAVAKGNAQLLQRLLRHPEALDRARLRTGLVRIDDALTAATGAIDTLTRRASTATTRAGGEASRRVAPEDRTATPYVGTTTQP